MSAWLTESRDAYRYFVAEPGALAVSPPASAAPKTSEAGAPTQPDEWVLVDVVPQDPQKSADIAAVEPGSPVPVKISRKSPRKRKKALPVTRHLTDTKFAELYNRPIMHTFGRNNTNPVVSGNYLKTHNVLERRPSQVYPSALTALERPEGYYEPRLPSPVQRGDDEEEDDGICDKITSIKHSIARSPKVHDPSVIFGVKSSSRKKDPSMYDVLAWHDEDYTPFEGYPSRQQADNEEAPKVIIPFSPAKQKVPAPEVVYQFVPTEHEELDPRNYKGKALDCLEGIPAAGDETAASLHVKDVIAFQ